MIKINLNIEKFNYFYEKFYEFYLCRFKFYKIKLILILLKHLKYYLIIKYIVKVQHLINNKTNI